MRSELRTLLSGLISQQRAKRDRLVAIRLNQLAAKIPVGHGARVVQFAAVCARELHVRGAKWLLEARRVLGETRTPWSPTTSCVVESLLRDELMADTRRLEAIYKDQFFTKQDVASHPSIVEACEAASNRLRLEIELLALAQEAARIPLAEHLGASRYEAVNVAWKKAHDAFNTTSPDFKIVVTEAIAAVEQLARLIVHQPTATLGVALKEIRRAGRIPAPLLKGIEELWGWSSGEPGLRHGASVDAPVDAASAKYVLSLADAALLLLLVRDTE